MGSEEKATSSESMPADDEAGRRQDADMTATTGTTTSADTVPTASQSTADQPQEPGIHVTVNGEAVHMTGKNSYIFVDIFNVIDFDIHAGGGRAVVTKINGANCGYSDDLHEGDVIEVYWEES